MNSIGLVRPNCYECIAKKGVHGGLYKMEYQENSMHQNNFLSAK